ncbi:hypothetical protein L9F63_010658, partial [Diploptera punctata]
VAGSSVKMISRIFCKYLGKKQLTRVTTVSALSHGMISSELSSSILREIQRVLTRCAPNLTSRVLSHEKKNGVRDREG